MRAIITAHVARGIKTAEIDEAGRLILTLTDGKEIDLGTVVGRDGIDGDKGDTGAIGPKGDKGEAGDLLNIGGAGAHNSLFRGQSLGTDVSGEQYAAIAAGTFTDMYIGDYWTINSIVYRIAAFDYYYRQGDTACNSHHVLLVPDTDMGIDVMNDTATTEGGYVGSKLYTQGLDSAKTRINAAFDGHVLTHRINLVNSMSSEGLPLSGAWCDSAVELMNEMMVYGCKINSVINGSNRAENYVVETSQLPLFTYCKEKIFLRDKTYWLRDPISSKAFASVSGYGPANTTASNSRARIRPYFCIY